MSWAHEQDGKILTQHRQLEISEVRSFLRKATHTLSVSGCQGDVPNSPQADRMFFRSGCVSNTIFLYACICDESTTFHG